MVQTFKWAILTPHGIYEGQLIGEIETGETMEQAMQAVVKTVRACISFEPTILACFVSDSELHIDAPGTSLTKLDLSVKFEGAIHVKP